MAVGAEGGGYFKSIWLSLACPQLPKILNSSVFHSDNAHTGPCRGLRQQPQPSHSPLAPSCFTRASARPATRDYTSNEGTKGGGTGLQPKNTPGNRTQPTFSAVCGRNKRWGNTGVYAGAKSVKLMAGRLLCVCRNTRIRERNGDRAWG